jgi:hypothetical protein
MVSLIVSFCSTTGYPQQTRKDISILYFCSLQKKTVEIMLYLAKFIVAWFWANYFSGGN